MIEKLDLSEEQLCPCDIVSEPLGTVDLGKRRPFDLRLVTVKRGRLELAGVDVGVLSSQ